MLGIGILLGGAALAHALARWLDVPAIPMLLFTGVTLSSTGLLPEIFLEEALLFGVTFLLFVGGLELNPRRVRAQKRAAVQVGLIQFVVLAGAGFAASVLLGFDVLGSAYLALALTASSTLVGLRILQRRQQMFEPFGRLVMGVLLLQDLLVVLTIPLLTDWPDGTPTVLRGVLASVPVLGLAYAVHRWGSPLVARLDGDEESVLLLALAILFVFLGFAYVLAVPVVAGAFLAGVSLSRFPTSDIVRAQLNSVADFFTAVFFTALGALISIPTATVLFQALVLALVVILVTPPLVTAIAERTGFSARPGLEAGLLLSQTSEFSLVVGLSGMMQGHISAEVFTVIAVVTFITMIATPFLTTEGVVWRLLRLHPVRAEAETPIPAADHVLLLGSGAMGTPLLETLLALGRPVVVVDDDPAVIKRLRDADVPCIRGDAMDVNVLGRARARQARIIVSMIRRPRDNGRLLQFARDVPVLVRVFEEQDAIWVRAMGGTPVLYSHAAADRLLQWYLRQEEAREADERVIPAG